MAVEITVNIFDIVQCIKIQEIKRMVWHHAVIEVQKNGFLLLMSGSLPTLEECTTVKVVINISGDVTGGITPNTARTIKGTIGIRKVSSHFVREAIKEMSSATKVVILGNII